MTEVEKKKIKIAIDTEFLSENIISGECLQLGLVAFYYDSQVNLEQDDWIVDKFSVCFSSQGKKINKETFNWWDCCFPDVLQRIKNEQVNIEKGMIDLHNWLSNLNKKYIISGYVADHSSVDMPWFRNLYLEYSPLFDEPLNLPWGCECTTNITKTIEKMYPDLKPKYLKKLCQNEKYPHTHYATEDALQTAYEYMVLDRFIFKKRNEEKFKRNVIGLSSGIIGAGLACLVIGLFNLKK